MGPEVYWKCSLYCVKQIEGGYKISTYDFRTGELLYESPKYDLYEGLSLTFDNNNLFDTFEIFQTSKGTELIGAIHYESDRPGNNLKTRVRIIDGKTGNQIYSVIYHESWSYSLHDDPFSNFIVLVLNPYRYFYLNRIPGEQFFAIMQKFSYASREATPNLPLSTDMVLMSHAAEVDGIGSGKGAFFDPFGLTGLCLNRVRDIGLKELLSLKLLMRNTSLQRQTSGMLCWQEGPGP
ncbi:hypothetical protein BDW68DRAFT_173439 [Aspergillus falconensis]